MPKDRTKRTDTSLASLDELARRINQAHEGAIRSARTAIEHAIECGRLLVEANGEWLPWLRENTKVSERTDRRWMRFAENSETLPAKPATVAELGSCEEQTRIRAGLLFGGQRRVVQTLCRRRRYATCFTGGSAKSTRHANISRQGISRLALDASGVAARIVVVQKLHQ